MNELREMIITCLMDIRHGLGYGAWQAIETFNTKYAPAIDATKGIPGKHTLQVGRHEITYTRK